MDTSLNISAFTHLRSLRVAAIGIALAAVGFVAPPASLADWDTLEPDQTASERAIALIEGSDSANFPVATADGEEFQPPTADERSIALIESKEAPGGVLAGGVPDTVRSADR
jgi:hypothetical protein